MNIVRKQVVFWGERKTTLPWHWNLMTAGLSTSLGVVKDIGLGWEVLNEHA